MSEVRVKERRAIVEEITLAPGDDVAPESKSWWHYALVATELGHDSVRELVREVDAVEAAGGMTTQDGSRRRTRGGVFFALVYERLGAKRSKLLRWRAARRFEEGMARRFVHLIAMVAPVNSAGTSATSEAAAPTPAPLAPTPATKPATPVPSGKPAHAPPTPAPNAASAGPAPRREPAAVEVLVVRRRPGTAASAAEPSPSKSRAGG